MKPKTITLMDGESVIAVVCENAAGPGWANAPAWIHIRTATGGLRSECIQPHQRSAELYTLFAFAEIMHRSLLAAVPVKRQKALKQIGP